jgi:hypothetical protein
MHLAAKRGLRLIDSQAWPAAAGCRCQCTSLQTDAGLVALVASVSPTFLKQKSAACRIIASTRGTQMFGYRNSAVNEQRRDVTQKPGLRVFYDVSTETCAY